jgi:glyoxylase-like metal-dependent hydrolase (beta-lactamase superfamily II)
VTKSGALAFPKAQFVFVDTEWNYGTGSRYESEVNSSPMPGPFKEATIEAARENLPPIADRSRFVKQGGEITSGVHYIAAPGHSPSHASILFASGNEQLMHMGDIAHHPVTSLQHPDWTPPSSTTSPRRRSSRARPFWTALRPIGSWCWAIISHSQLLDMPSDATRIPLGSRSMGLVASG